MELITSAKNPLLMHIRKLQASRSYRTERGEFLCEGHKLLGEALRWYPQLKTVVLAEGTDCPPLPPQTRVVTVPQSLMQSLSTMKTPQGVIFTCALPRPGTPQLMPGMLVLDRIQDPGNLGTVLRTADALGVPVLLTNDCADPFSEKAVRASMGAVLRIRPCSLPLDVFTERLVQSGLPLAVTALSEDAADICTVSVKDYIVVIGSEGQGISPELFTIASKKIIIPMQPHCESLNAAVAAAIVMWQMRV